MANSAELPHEPQPDIPNDFDVRYEVEGYTLMRGGNWVIVDPSTRQQYLSRLDFREIGDCADFVVLAMSEERKQCVVLRKGTRQLRFANYLPDAPTVAITRVTHNTEVQVTHQATTDYRQIDPRTIYPSQEAVLNEADRRVREAEKRAADAEVKTDILQRRLGTAGVVAGALEDRERVAAAEAHAASETQRADALQERLRQEEQIRQNADAENNRLRLEAEATRRRTRWRFAAAIVAGIAGGVAGTLSFKDSPTSDVAFATKHSAEPLIALQEKRGQAVPGGDVSAKTTMPRTEKVAPVGPSRGQIMVEAADRERVRRTPFLENGLTKEALLQKGIVVENGGLYFMLSDKKDDRRELATIDPENDTRAIIGIENDDIVFMQARKHSGEHRERFIDTFVRISPKSMKVETIDYYGDKRTPDPSTLSEMQWPKKHLLLKDAVPSIHFAPGTEKELRDRILEVKTSPGFVQLTRGDFVAATVEGADGVEVTKDLDDIHITFVHDTGFGYTEWQRYVVDPLGRVSVIYRRVQEYNPTAHPPKPRARDGIREEPEWFDENKFDEFPKSKVGRLRGLPGETEDQILGGWPHAPSKKSEKK